MAGRRRGRWRRSGLVFAGSFAAHVAVLTLVATRPVAPAPAGSAAERATPIALTAFPKPAKLEPRRRAKVARTAGLVARAPVYQGTAPLQLPVGDELQAPLAPLPQSGDGDDDPIDLAGAAPPDLTQAAPQASYPINPGYWEVAEHWLLLRRTERYCVEPWNITRFMAAPCNHLYHCDYPVQVIDADRFHFSGVIWRRDERYRVAGGGAFSPTSLHLSVAGMGHFHFLPFAFSASLDGRYLGSDCPADAKRIRQAQADGGKPPPP